MAAPDKPSPAIETLKKVLKAEFPQVDTQTGIGNQPASRHTSGIALDIMLNYKNDNDAKIGRRIMAGLAKNLDAMQWSAFIFTVRTARAWAGSLLGARRRRHGLRWAQARGRQLHRRHAS